MLTRTIPTFGSRRSLHIFERNFMVYRSQWLMLVSGFFEPLFYLLSIGVGLGRLVGHVAGPAGHSTGYTAFVAPALLASSAMNGAVYDSTLNVYFKLKFAAPTRPSWPHRSTWATWPSARSRGRSCGACCTPPSSSA